MGRHRVLICTGLLVAAACDARGPATPGTEDEPRSYHLNFGQVAVGSARTLTVSLPNPGGRGGLVEVQDVDAPFEVAERRISVVPGRTRVDVRFVFRPGRRAREARKATVVTPSGVREVFLSGEGTVPAVSCTPQIVDLGVVLAPGEVEATVTCSSALERVALQLGPFEDPTGRFDRLLSLPEGETTVFVPAGSRKVIRVRLDARVEGDLAVTLPIREVRDPTGPRHDVELRARVVSTLLSLEPRDVDFGFVEPGQSLLRAVTIENHTRSPVQLGLLEGDPGQVPPFDIQLPDEIPPDDPATPAAEHRATILLRFRPQTYGPVQHVWRLTASGDRVPGRIDVPVKGMGGGPSLECDPTVDFGVVALGVSYPSTLRCRNVGVNGGPLELTSVKLGSSEFSLDPASSRNPRPTAEGWEIDLLFQPAGKGPRQSVMTVGSNGGSVEVTLSGQGEPFDGCDFHVLPLRGLDFGTVEPGRSLALEVTVTNRGGGPCLLRDLRPGTASSTVFSLVPQEVVEIAPGGQLVVPVTASSDQELGEVSGSIEFWISRPGASRQRVSLAAEIASGCLRFEPSLLELGRVPIGCRGIAGTVQVRNTCRTPVSIVGLGLASTFSTSFELVNPPSVPLAVPANGSLGLRVAYRPAQARVERGGVLLQTAEGAEFIAMVEGRGLAEGEPLEKFTNARAVDVLVVSDDSAEMADLHDGLRSLGEALAQELFDRAADFHLGVTGTSIEVCEDPAVPVPDGRLLPLAGDRVVARFDEGFVATFAANVEVPTCSDDSAGLEAALRAITPPLSTAIDDLRHPEPDDGNASFLRTGTDLAVVFLAATEDLSPRDAADYTHELAGLARPRITAHAIGPSTDSCRQGSGRYQNVVQDTGGYFKPICDDDWASEQTARELAIAIAPDRLRYVLANQPPDMNGDGQITEAAGEISVTVSGELTPSVDFQGRRWTYAAGVLEFVPERPPPPGAPIGVRYGLVCE